MSRPIDADRLIGWFKEHNPFDEFPAEYICGIINEQPTVQPQRMRGRWQVYKLAERGEAWTVQCSVCHSIGFHGKTPYCPECGAQMDGGEQDG